MLYRTSLQWLENEKSRLGHLRDRASEKGRRKEYPWLKWVFELYFFPQRWFFLLPSRLHFLEYFMTCMNLYMVTCEHEWVHTQTHTHTLLLFTLCCCLCCCHLSIDYCSTIITLCNVSVLLPFRSVMTKQWLDIKGFFF